MKSVLMFVVLMISSGMGHTCSCEEMNQATLFKQADAVFLAEVTDTVLKKVKSGLPGIDTLDVIEAKFQVLEYFKTSKREIAVVRDFSFAIGNCSIGLMSGMEYIFFVSENGLGMKNYVGMCTGSTAVNIHAVDFQNNLKELRSYGADAKK